MNKILIIGSVAVLAHIAAFATSAVLCYMYFATIMEGGGQPDDGKGELNALKLQVDCFGKTTQL